jgi:hypothetical protein
MRTRTLDRQSPDPLQRRCERFAIDVFHGQVMPPLGVTDVVDAADVRMRNLAGEPDLGDETLQTLVTAICMRSN